MEGIYIRGDDYPRTSVTIVKVLFLADGTDLFEYLKLLPYHNGINVCEGIHDYKPTKYNDRYLATKEKELRIEKER